MIDKPVIGRDCFNKLKALHPEVEEDNFCIAEPLESAIKKNNENSFQHIKSKQRKRKKYE